MVQKLPIPEHQLASLDVGIKILDGKDYLIGDDARPVLAIANLSAVWGFGDIYYL